MRWTRPLRIVAATGATLVLCAVAVVLGVLVLSENGVREPSSPSWQFRVKGYGEERATVDAHNGEWQYAYHCWVELEGEYPQAIEGVTLDVWLDFRDYLRAQVVSPKGTVIRVPPFLSPIDLSSSDELPEMFRIMVVDNLLETNVERE